MFIKISSFVAFNLWTQSNIRIQCWHGQISTEFTRWRDKRFSFWGGVDGADENSRVWSMASVDSTVRGVLPLIATEDGTGESVRGRPGGVVGGTHRCFGGGPGGGVIGINRFSL